MIVIVISVVALVIVAATITLTMRAVVRARDLAQSRAIQLERLNEEVQRVATRATKLLDVTTALSEARTVEEVTAVMLGKGLEVVEAARGVLVSVEGDRLRLLGAKGMSEELQTQLASLSAASEIPLVHSLRKGEMITIDSGEEFAR